MEFWDIEILSDPNLTAVCIKVGTQLTREDLSKTAVNRTLD
jgi:hypothetical protein